MGGDGGVGFVGGDDGGVEVVRLEVVMAMDVALIEMSITRWMRAKHHHGDLLQNHPITAHQP